MGSAPFKKSHIVLSVEGFVAGAHGRMHRPIRVPLLHDKRPGLSARPPPAGTWMLVATCLCAWLSVCVHVCVHGCLSVCMSVCMSVDCVCMALSVYVCLGACLSAFLPVCMLVSLSLWLSVCRPVIPSAVQYSRQDIEIHEAQQ